MSFFKPKLGLALGGGAARGVAHTGVLKAFEDNGIKIDTIAGNSAGSLVASLYANGIKLERIYEIMANLNWFNFFGLTFNRGGLMNNEFIGQIIEDEIGINATIESSAIPLSINASNINTGELVILREGGLAKAVMASTSAQGLYTPVDFEGKILTDGGIVENVPIASLLESNCDIIFAINLNGQVEYPKTESLFDVLANAFDIAIDTTTKMQLKHAQIVMNYNLMGYPRAEAKEHAQNLFDLGYLTTNQVLKEYNLNSPFTKLRLLKTKYYSN